MSVGLTTREIKTKANFERIVTTFKPTSGMEQFEVEFHREMQNPFNNEIAFDFFSRNIFSNELLSTMADYFSHDGNHLFGNTVKKLTISRIPLREFKDGWDQVLDGTVYVAQLIAKNPKISGLGLTHASLMDSEANQLLKALNSNTKLIELDLRGNDISPEINNAIALKIQKNRELNMGEIRFAARLIMQSMRTQTGGFAALPAVINAMIAAFTGPSFATYDETLVVARKSFLIKL